MNKLILLLLTIVTSSLWAENAPVDEKKLLSSHETIAVFNGTQFHKCRHMTSLCPDKCTHAGSVAVFKIKEYLDYQKPGKYGDSKATLFQTMIEDQLGTQKVSQRILDTIKSLKKGDTVKLSWNHNYVTKGGASYPVRAITLLESLAPAPKEK